MWQNVSFQAFPDILFQYNFDDELFYVKCEIRSSHISGGKVQVCCGDTALILGTLGDATHMLCLHKTYPVSYLESGGIDAKRISHFCIITDSGISISSYPLDITDPAVARAEELLRSMPGRGNYAHLAQRCIQNIRSFFDNSEKVKLPFLSQFDWCVITDIKHTFSLSSVEHILFAPEFMHCYLQSRCWFFGICEKKHIFALCIRASRQCPNPMANALDCVEEFVVPGDDAVYYAIGIGLFDDGQYFCKLSD